MNDNATPTVTPAPPPPPPEAPQQKVDVKIGDWLSAGWKLFAADWLKASVAMLIALVIGMVTCLLLWGPMTVGLYKCYLKKARGQDYEYGELFDGLKTQFIPSFLLMLMFWVVIIVPSVVLGFIPCVGSIISMVWSFVVSAFIPYAFYKMADAQAPVQVGSLVDLLKDVYAKMQPALPMMVLWVIVAGIIGQAGVIACGIGVFASSAFAALALAVSYLEVFKGEQAVIPQQ
ncbi:hypothetical protein GX586_07780 [bacterium]|nr:hypothetical protein [bacterium]